VQSNSLLAAPKCQAPVIYLFVVTSSEVMEPAVVQDPSVASQPSRCSPAWAGKKGSTMLTLSGPFDVLLLVDPCWFVSLSAL